MKSKELACVQLITRPFAKERDMKPVVQNEAQQIVRRVKVNRSLTPQQMLDESDRTFYVDPNVVTTISQGEGEEVNVYFFALKRCVPVHELAQEYEMRGLKVDPYAQVAVNRDDPIFANEHPNGCQWQDNNGKYCCLVFYLGWRGEHGLDVDYVRGDWDEDWWFAGVKK